MSYDPTIPADLPPPAIAVDSIRTNFQQYQAAFNANHSPLNSSNQGKHTTIIFEAQSDDPIVDGSFDTLYNKSVAAAIGNTQEFFSRIPKFLPNDLPNAPTQLTFNQVNTTGPNQYQSFLPGGYIFYFGTSTGPGTITLSPAPTEIVCAIANTNNFTTTGLVLFPFNCSVTVLNTSQFSINSTFGSGTFTWFAIAKQ